MNWKEYEQEIADHFRTEYPSAIVTANAKIKGRYSGVNREIDLLVEQNACDFFFRIVIDAKFRKRKLDVKDVEEFLGLARDVSADKAVMISPVGYSKAALGRASSDDVDVILDVLNFKEMKDFHGLGAIPYSGKNGAFIQPPLGWVVDGTQGQGALAWLYERGLTLDNARRRREFMYVNFWSKHEGIVDIQGLNAYQEAYLREHSENPIAEVQMLQTPKRADAETAIRMVRFLHHPAFAEYTGFVDFGSFIFMCVLFTPDTLRNKNLSKLQFVIRKVRPIHLSRPIVHGRAETALADGS